MSSARSAGLRAGDHVPAERVRSLNDAPLRPAGEHVVYWMVAARRVHYNFALQRAVEHALRLDRPLVILEALRLGYRWASERLHRFVLDGMAENSRLLAGGPALNYPYVETEEDAGRGLLVALAEAACVVVTDDYPAFFIPRMIEAAAARINVRLEAVDSRGILPARAAGKLFLTAASFRRRLHAALPQELGRFPLADPLASLPRRPEHELALNALGRRLRRRWPPAPAALLEERGRALASLPLDHRVAPVAGTRGGSAAARASWRRFLEQRLPRYAEQRNNPDEEATSGLSPYLHFGYISAHEVLRDLLLDRGWRRTSLVPGASGARQGFYGLDPSAEAFLEQLLTWRELGHNLCLYEPAYTRFEGLPAWARRELDAHAGDRRPYRYSPAQLEQAATHDAVWNAAQRELLERGRIHNYLRMLWGKKILEWTSHPREALQVMIELNDRYALDGRDPSSYCGITWVLGRYDRPWGPRRPVYGLVRYMSSESARRRFRLERYLVRFGS